MSESMVAVLERGVSDAFTDAIRGRALEAMAGRDRRDRDD